MQGLVTADVELGFLAHPESGVHPGVVKGWHLHEKNVLNYAVIVGMIKLVLFDPRFHPLKSSVKNLPHDVDHSVLIPPSQAGTRRQTQASRE